MRIKILLNFIIGLTVTNLFLENARADMFSCYVVNNDFISGATPYYGDFKVEIRNGKMQPAGANKLLTIQSYEFWIMGHTVINPDKTPDLLSFQVAIKDTKSGVFAHALSHIPPDAVHAQNSKARVSLVKYHNNSLVAQSELFLECSQIQD